MLAYLMSWFEQEAEAALEKPYSVSGNCKKWNGKCQHLIQFDDLITDRAKILAATPEAYKSLVSDIINEAKELPALNHFDNLYIVGFVGSDAPAIREANFTGIIQLKNMKLFASHQAEVPPILCTDIQRFLELDIYKPEEVWPGRIRDRIINRVYQLQ